jgi:hypothetical protein
VAEYMAEREKVEAAGGDPDRFNDAFVSTHDQMGNTEAPKIPSLRVVGPEGAAQPKSVQLPTPSFDAQGYMPTMPPYSPQYGNDLTTELGLPPGQEPGVGGSAEFDNASEDQFLYGPAEDSALAPGAEPSFLPFLREVGSDEAPGPVYLDSDISMMPRRQTARPTRDAPTKLPDDALLSRADLWDSSPREQYPNSQVAPSTPLQAYSAGDAVEGWQRTVDRLRAPFNATSPADAALRALSNQQRAPFSLEDFGDSRAEYRPRMPLPFGRYAEGIDTPQGPARSVRTEQANALQDVSVEPGQRPAQRTFADEILGTYPNSHDPVQGPSSPAVPYNPRKDEFLQAANESLSKQPSDPPAPPRAFASEDDVLPSPEFAYNSPRMGVPEELRALQPLSIDALASAASRATDGTATGATDSAYDFSSAPTNLRDYIPWARAQRQELQSRLAAERALKRQNAATSAAEEPMGPRRFGNLIESPTPRELQRRYISAERRGRRGTTPFAQNNQLVTAKSEPAPLVQPRVGTRYSGGSVVMTDPVSGRRALVGPSATDRMLAAGWHGAETPKNAPEQSPLQTPNLANAGLPPEATTGATRPMNTPGLNVPSGLYMPNEAQSQRRLDSLRLARHDMTNMTSAEGGRAQIAPQQRGVGRLRVPEPTQQYTDAHIRGLQSAEGPAFRHPGNSYSPAYHAPSGAPLSPDVVAPTYTGVQGLPNQTPRTAYNINTPGGTGEATRTGLVRLLLEGTDISTSGTTTAFDTVPIVPNASTKPLVDR